MYYYGGPKPPRRTGSARWARASPAAVRAGGRGRARAGVGAGAGAGARAGARSVIQGGDMSGLPPSLQVLVAL